MPDEVANPRNLKIGLAILAVVLTAALVGAIVVESTTGKAIMVAIAVMVLVRAYLISRRLRHDGAAGVASP